jgi:hypothetical protein
MFEDVEERIGCMIESIDFRNQHLNQATYTSIMLKAEVDVSFLRCGHYTYTVERDKNTRGSGE